MKTTILKSLSLLTIASTLFVISCKKEEPVTPISNTNTGSPSSLGSFFANNESVATQTFTINANSYQNITGAKGIKIYFSPGTFKTASGAVATGNITIKLVEVQSKADMILLNKTTTSNGRLLVSGGEFSIKAFQNGQQLTLANNNSSMYVSMPSQNPGDNNMILFAGQPTATGDVNWTLTGLNGPNNGVSADSANFGYSFTLGSDSLPTPDSLGWINCDVFANNSNNSHFSVGVPSGHIGGNLNPNTQVYIYFENINSVVGLGWDATIGKFVTSSYTTGLPVGEPIKIVAISEKSGQYYYSITPTTITANMSPSVILTPASATAIKNAINAL